MPAFREQIPLSELEFHPAANFFPLDEENIDALSADIKANGQYVPIELIDGLISDGRRRYLACKRAGVEPITVEVDPADPVAYVLSLNLHRRHLTPAQAAMIGARARRIMTVLRKSGSRSANGHTETLADQDCQTEAVGGLLGDLPSR